MILKNAVELNVEKIRSAQRSKTVKVCTNAACLNKLPTPMAQSLREYKPESDISLNLESYQQGFASTNRWHYPFKSFLEDARVCRLSSLLKSNWKSLISDLTTQFKDRAVATNIFHQLRLLD